jgi:hypothetical protein
MGKVQKKGRVLQYPNDIKSSILINCLPTIDDKKKSTSKFANAEYEPQNGKLNVKVMRQTYLYDFAIYSQGAY